MYSLSAKKFPTFNQRSADTKLRSIPLGPHPEYNLTLENEVRNSLPYYELNPLVPEYTPLNGKSDFQGFTEYCLRVGRSQPAIFGRDSVSYENPQQPLNKFPRFANPGEQSPPESDLLDVDWNIDWVDKLLADSPKSSRKFRNILDKRSTDHNLLRPSESANIRFSYETSPLPKMSKSPYRTPSPFKRPSPPKLIRHPPGSNLWCQNTPPGEPVNSGYCCCRPYPVRLAYGNEYKHNYNIRALEDGISRGYVNVRDQPTNTRKINPPYFTTMPDLTALEEGLARGWVNMR